MPTSADFVESLGEPFLAHRLRRHVAGFVDAAGRWLPEAGVDVPPKAGSMMLLLGHGPQPVTGIAARLRLSHPFIVHLVAELGGRGLVETGADPADARVRLVSLTRAGVDQARRLARAHRAIAAAYRSVSRDAGVDLAQAIPALEAALARRGFDDRLREGWARTRSKEER